ncbi:MAG: ATP-binding cassette domain-containing protein, partial [Zavarzinella sp.]|nr:ATP-binding cassette domain-containing protein [Zavarzinella sp.]
MSDRFESDEATPVVFRAAGATVTRPTGGTVVENLSWTVREDESWAIVGPTGSGKTALTDVMLGRLHTVAGTVEWPLLDRLRAGGQPVGWPSEVIGRVGFREESKLFSYSRHYYQQRFNFIEPDDDLTLDQFLRAGVAATDESLDRVTRRLGLSELRSLSFIKLSNGQTRRARIARALLTHPEILILDEPFVGLDAAGQKEVRSSLQKLRDEGTRLVLITGPDSVPEWVTHVLEMDRGRIVYQGRRTAWSSTGLPPPAAPARATSTSTPAEPIIELRHVNVTHGGRPILRDITWTVRAGERWAVLGPNGSGKTTLLSLVCGDHPQAYSNDIRVFGRRRGAGESIWDVKRRIGLVSPEMHLYFTEPLTAERAAATGFFDILVARPTTAEQDAAVRDLFAYFRISDIARRPFAQLSSGQQRIVLLIRALVKDPPLLILDEPFQVLDAATQQRARDWIDGRLGADRTVLFVTHNESE